MSGHGAVPAKHAPVRAPRGAVCQVAGWALMVTGIPSRGALNLRGSRPMGHGLPDRRLGADDQESRVGAPLNSNHQHCYIAGSHCVASGRLETTRTPESAVLVAAWLVAGTADTLPPTIDNRHWEAGPNHRNLARRRRGDALCWRVLCDAL